MSLHRLSAGTGYTYLLRHTASADVDRAAGEPLAGYYAASGNPPGRWLGAGLEGLGADGRGGIAAGSVVSEEQMAALFGRGHDPLTGVPLGRAYRHYAPAGATPARHAVAGFDLTFTVPKSVSVLWALAAPDVREQVVAAHRAAVADTLAYLETSAIRTRTGADGAAQVPTRGMVAAAFDHVDSRAGDPTLHAHVVVANRVQGPDGRWRSLDSRALHHAAVAASELYDDLLADHLTASLPVRFEWRNRGERRSPAFELRGVDDGLLAAFSTRAADIDVHLRGLLAEFTSKRGRRPSRVEVTRLRQQATLATRPPKTPHPLTTLFARWVDTARRVTGRTPQQIASGVLSGQPDVMLRHDQVSPTMIDRLATVVVDGLLERRSTWTVWNVRAETARATRGLRMATTGDRLALHDRLTAAVLARNVSLAGPDPVPVIDGFTRPDGSSAFTRPDETRYTDPRLLHAEQRLLEAHHTLGAPTVPEHVAARVANTPQHPTVPRGRAVRLADDQVHAVIKACGSGRLVDVLVGPAGTGKTTTLRALRTAWETIHGRGSVQGLAPSASAAAELAVALAIPCENTAKWRHETAGRGRTQRQALLATLQHRLSRTPAGPKAARISAQIGALILQERQWQLRPGTLLVVDEASLAATLDLDQLTGQARAAGAKVLLVGDHHQLSAVAAGGAFGLLADTGRPSTLRSLWRFTHRWEAAATRRLRDGDPTVLDDYQQHGRIRGGPADQVLEDAYTAWQADTDTGHASLLIAPDTTTVTALNTRAHADRRAAGTITGLVVPLGDEACGGLRGHAGAGDRIITRRNQRTLRLPSGGHVRNGALWTVVAVHPDGALTVTPSTPGSGEPSGEAAVRLPPSYVREHVDPGYATTAHRAQGVTVDTAHVLAAPGMAREALYVAMTRGRHANTIHVPTDTPDPDCRHTPDVEPETNARQVLAEILATTSRELSATQTAQHFADETRSLRRLIPIRDTLRAESLHALVGDPDEGSALGRGLAEVEHLVQDRLSDHGFAGRQPAWLPPSASPEGGASPRVAAQPDGPPAIAPTASARFSPQSSPSARQAS